MINCTNCFNLSFLYWPRLTSYSTFGFRWTNNAAAVQIRRHPHVPEKWTERYGVPVPYQIPETQVSVNWSIKIAGTSPLQRASNMAATSWYSNLQSLLSLMLRSPMRPTRRIIARPSLRWQKEHSNNPCKKRMDATNLQGSRRIMMLPWGRAAR